LLAVLEVLKAADVDDRIRQPTEMTYQALIEAELSSVIGAVPRERTSARTGQRNGHRPGVLPSAANDLELRIPKLRAGSFLAIRHEVFIFLRDRRSPPDQTADATGPRACGTAN
jgi:transposase-like protein